MKHARPFIFEKISPAERSARRLGRGAGILLRIRGFALAFSWWLGYWARTSQAGLGF